MKEIADAGMLNDYMTKNQIENLLKQSSFLFACVSTTGERF